MVIFATHSRITHSETNEQFLSVPENLSAGYSKTTAHNTVVGNNLTRREAMIRLSSSSSLCMWLVLRSLVLFSEFVAPAAAAEAISSVDEVSFRNATRISYVIEPFEAMGTLDGSTSWTWKDSDASFTLMSSNENKLHGNHSVIVEFSDTTTVDFGWIQSDRPHNCYGADEIALWVKVLSGDGEVQNEMPVSQINLTVTLYNDLQCTLLKADRSTTTSNNDTNADDGSDCSLARNLDSFVIMEQSFDVQTDTNTWIKMIFPVSSFPKSFDLRRIRGWRIWLAGQGMIIFDQLACFGDGHKMMGAAFVHPLQDMDFAVKENSWMEEYYESKRASNYTERSLRIEEENMDDNSTYNEYGVLSVRYMVEQTELWGE